MHEAEYLVKNYGEDNTLQDLPISSYDTIA